MTEWSGKPAYQQVADALRMEIRAGRLPSGSRLPSLADLMHKYQVSITVIRMALAQLKAAGFVVSHQGKGTFVREKLPAEEEGPDLVGPAVFDAVMDQLQTIHTDLRRIDERLERLERLAKVDSKQNPPAGRRGS